MLLSWMAAGRDPNRWRALWTRASPSPAATTFPVRTATRPRSIFRANWYVRPYTKSQNVFCYLLESITNAYAIARVLKCVRARRTCNASVHFELLASECGITVHLHNMYAGQYIRSYFRVHRQENVHIFGDIKMYICFSLTYRILRCTC